MKFKKLFISVLIIWISLIISPRAIYSQGYIPLLTDSIYWDIAYADMNQIICNEFGAPGTGTYRYKLDTDTIINGATYRSFKAFLIYSILPQPSPNCPPFTVDTIPINNLWTNNNFMREDTTNRKVYLYSNITGAGQEFLLYDFNMQVGDTIAYPYYGIPFVVDTVYNVTTLDGVTRKFFQSVYQIGPSPCYFIEGLGGCAGMFHEPIYYFENGPWLMCVKNKDQNTIFAPSPTQWSYCYNFTIDVPQYTPDRTPVTFFPNPSGSFLTFNNIPKNSTVEITTTLGQTYTLYAINEDIPVSIEHLPTGIYSICLLSKKSRTQIGRLIKQ